MHVNVIPFVGGVAITVFSTLTLIYRAKFARFIATSQRAMFGRFAEPTASRSKPGGLIAPAIFGVTLGIAMVLLSLFYQSPTP